jgi:hypothetical protein
MKFSEVYFCNLRASFKENFLFKLGKAMDMGGLDGIVQPRNLVAVKLHFGEKGNTAFIRPVFVRRVVEKIKTLGGSPFLTDTNTLYAGARGDSISHLNTAVGNGFAYSVVQAPIIIADGLRGASYLELPIKQENIQTAYLGKEIVESDALLSIAHFKGHELSGFGGTLKNIGMGCASRKGKLEQHSGMCPKVKHKKCVGCGECLAHCAQAAISIPDDKAVIDPGLCVGCGECILICPNEAVQIQWNKDIPLFQRKMAEYAYAALQDKKDRALFLNFLTDISPACDCPPYCDAPIVRNIGVLVSRDPVAVDQAAVDLVNNQTAAGDSCLNQALGPGEDKFKALYPKVDWSVQLAHSEKLGL